ncbi:MAG: DUF1232 domain-containing protein [Nocardioidaceae bacterium]|nr:DUF1232 domain-containing protein [Nocardioidaceae bacterium]
MWWHLLIGVTCVLAVSWGLLVGGLWIAKPDKAGLRASLRLLPDVVRLLSRLARDRSLPLRVRAWLWVLLAYLASPIDVIPDFVPVLGYADDVVLVVIALRFVIRRAGRERVLRHWPGTPDGLAALERLTRGDPRP